MKPKWKRVGTHGQPPPESYVHVRQTVGELARVKSVGNKWSNDTLYLTDDDLAALLPAPDDIEPAPRKFCLWHGGWVGEGTPHGEQGPSCQVSDLAPPWWHPGGAS